MGTYPVAGIWSHCGWLGAKDNLELGVSGVSLQPESSGGLPEGLFCWGRCAAGISREPACVGTCLQSMPTGASLALSGHSSYSEPASWLRHRGECCIQWKGRNELSLFHQRLSLASPQYRETVLLAYPWVLISNLLIQLFCSVFNVLSVSKYIISIATFSLNYFHY